MHTCTLPALIQNKPNNRKFGLNAWLTEDSVNIDKHNLTFIACLQQITFMTKHITPN